MNDNSRYDANHDLNSSEILSMSLKRYLTLICLFVACTSALSATNESEWATLILKKIYIQTGNFSIELPQVQIRDSREFMAAYSPDRNTIYLEQTALNVCRSFGKDAEKALAFLLGHELSHAFQQVGWATNFISYDYQEHSSIHLEKSADLQGAMGAILAGFDIRPIIPSLLDRLYNAYGLTNRRATGYPSLEDRQTTAAQVSQKANELWHLYQTANYLNVIEQHQMAISAYEHILQHYIGKEIYNNLGLQYAKLAMNFSGKNSDPFIFPFEIETESRLSKARAEDLSPEEMRIRKRYLLAASAYFNKALGLDPGYTPAKINALCVSIQLGRFQSVIQAYESRTLAAGFNFSDSRTYALADLNMIAGIAYALSGQSNNAHFRTAIAIFDNLSQDTNKKVRSLAFSNKSILNGAKPIPPPMGSCPPDLTAGNNVDGLSLFSLLAKPGQFIDKEKQTEFYWEERLHSIAQVIRHRGAAFPLQRIVKPRPSASNGFKIGQYVNEFLASHKNLSYTTIGAGEKYYLHFRHCRTVLLIGPNGKIEEWAKYLD